LVKTAKDVAASWYHFRYQRPSSAIANAHEKSRKSFEDCGFHSVGVTGFEPATFCTPLKPVRIKTLDFR
jgi:hypothetical protein